MNRKIAVSLLALIVVFSGSTGAAARGGVSTDPTSITDVEQQVLFRAGTGGYGCFRIPAMVRTRAGTLLAFAEGRKAPSCGDRGDIDIVVRRSTNNGRSWGPISAVPDGTIAQQADGGSPTPGAPPDQPVTHDNPAPVVDLNTGRIYLLSDSNPTINDYPRLPWIQASDDDGLTWSDPKKLPVNLVPPNPPAGSQWLATGPGHGIQLTEGAHQGRLVVGMEFKIGMDPATSHYYTGYVYLDPPTTTGSDPSVGWQAAKAADSGSAAPSEVAVAETTSTGAGGTGGVYEVARKEGGTTRTSAVGSTPAGSTVPTIGPFTSDSIPSYGNVQGSLLRIHSGADQQYLLAAPSGNSGRNEMTIFSRCNGAWQSTSTRINTGSADYSDLAQLADNEIGLLYEAGYDEIRFLHIPEKTLGLSCNNGTPAPQTISQPNQPTEPTTPDATPQANDAYLYNAPTLTSPTPALAGNALSLNGTSQYAEAPYTSTLDPGSDDFTYSMWFKYRADPATPPDDPGRVLMWAYGLGSDAPQLWVRAQPGSDKITALAQGSTTATPVSVSVPGNLAFGDDTWHHLTITRTGSTLALTVGHEPTASASGLTGSIAGTTDHTVGLWLGARPTITTAAPSQFFPGSIDEVRLYRTALTAAQTTQLDTPAALLDAATERTSTLRLPFAAIDPGQAVTRTSITGIDDESGHCADASMTGTGHPSNESLNIAPGGVTGVHTPMSPSIDIGAGDFTFSMKFWFDGATDKSDRALIWAYGMGDNAQQLWVQALPKDGKVTAAVVTDTGTTATVSVPGANAFGDNDDKHPHTLALERKGGALSLTIDNKYVSPPATTQLTGSVTSHPSDRIGLTVGARPDGTKILNGHVQEFTMYKRALTSAELGTLSGPGLVTADRTIRWPFNRSYATNAYRPQPAGTPTTPDTSNRCHNAYLLDGATTASTGRLALNGGSAQVISGADAELTGDFTVSTSAAYTFANGATSQTLFWAYGTGPTARQLWLRATKNADGTDEIDADVQTGLGNVLLTGQDGTGTASFADGTPHQFTLVRSGTTLTLYVDGRVLAQNPSTAPSVGPLVAPDTSTAQTLRLGARPDGTQSLNGSLDNVLVFTQALDAAGVAGLSTGAIPSGTTPVVNLPFTMSVQTTYPRM